MKNVTITSLHKKVRNDTIISKDFKKMRNIYGLKLNLALHDLMKSGKKKTVSERWIGEMVSAVPRIRDSDDYGHDEDRI